MVVIVHGECVQLWVQVKESTQVVERKVLVGHGEMLDFRKRLFDAMRVSGFAEEKLQAVQFRKPLVKFGHGYTHTAVVEVQFVQLSEWSIYLHGRVDVIECQLSQCVAAMANNGIMDVTVAAESVVGDSQVG